MSDVWESAGLVTEVWESNTTPGVEWRVIIRDGDIVVSDEQIAAAIVAYFDGSTPVLEGDGAGGALSGTYPSPGLNTEAVQDLVGAMAGAGLTYDDETGLIDADPPGVPDHNDTTNRDAVDAHPISSITGLQAALDAAGGGGADLSDATPQDLGTAAAGVSTEASRADHVHDMPTAATLGVAPAPSLLVTGQYSPSSQIAPVNTGLTNNRLYYVPRLIPRDMTISRIAVNQAATGSAGAGSVGKFGIYANTDDLPGEAFDLPAGTIDLGTGTGLKYVSGAWVLTAGIWWFSFVAQVTSGSPTFSTAPPAIVVPSSDATNNGTKFQNSVTGTLPSTATPSAANTTGVPIIYLYV